MSPTLAEAKEVATCFVDIINRREFASLPSLFAPDAQWVVVADEIRSGWGGSFTAKEVFPRVEAVLNPFNMWSYTAKDYIVDGRGTRLVIEAVGKGRGPGPLTYDNNYMMRLHLDENGKIKELKETLDAYQVEIMNESMRLLRKEIGSKEAGGASPP